MSNETQQINAALSYVSEIGSKSHAAGDEAAARARSAKDRRTERKFQSVNKAHRATGTACEASLFLTGLMVSRFRGSKCPAAFATQQMLRFSTEASKLIDDLNFEANVISALAPEVTKPKGKR